MEINSNRSNARLVADEKFDIEVSNVIGNSEINSSRNDDKAFANKKLEVPNIEINDVTENSEENLESLLGKKKSLKLAQQKFESICSLKLEKFPGRISHKLELTFRSSSGYWTILHG